jgi:hypothetical protein
MEQRISGFRVWFWAVLALAVAGGLLLLIVLRQSGFHVLAFDPRLLLFFVFFAALHVAFFVFMRGKDEEKGDLP